MGQAVSNLRSVRDQLDRIIEPPIDDADDMPGDDRFGDYGDGRRPPRVLPEGCPVTAVGTQDNVFYFLTALGELRGLTADKVANKHIIGMFAPDSKFLEDAWPRKKKIIVTDPETKEQHEEWIVTGWRADDVSMLLMDVAAARGVWDAREKVRGRGAWIGDDGGLILHCGNHVMIGGRWVAPGMYDGLVYPTAPPIPKPLNSSGRVQTAMDVAPQLVKQLRARGIPLADSVSPAVVLLELFKTWNWARPLIDPILLMGWIASAKIGGALDYRPLAWITGGKATGKSALQKILGWLFEGGILQSPDASEAAVRQVLGQQSLPVAIDEAEAEADNRKLLALVKLARLAASSQGNILRGGQDHKGHEFQATSCFLFSSILVPPMPPQDKSRLAMLELGELPAGSREPRYDKREIAAIGAWILKRLADRWPTWPAVLESYTDALLDTGGQGGRASDQFGTLRAAAHVLLDDDMPDDDELAMWGQLLGLTALAETSDETDEGPLCLVHLASSLVQLAGHGTPRLVSDWLVQASQPVTSDSDPEVRDKVRAAQEALGKVGLRIVTGSAGKAPIEGERARPIPGRCYVGIASNHRGLARLFEGSRWHDGVWSQALGRVRGAVKGQTQRIGHVSQKCTLVPIESVVERDEVDAVARGLVEA